MNEVYLVWKQFPHEEAHVVGAYTTSDKAIRVEHSMEMNDPQNIYWTTVCSLDKDPVFEESI